MNHFTGHFFCLTRYSLYRVTVPSDLVSRPQVQKWSTRRDHPPLDREIKITVGDCLRHGHTVGITSRGLFQYSHPIHLAKLPVPFDQVSRVCKAKGVTKTSPLRAIFLDRKSAEECHHAGTAMVESEPFHPSWWVPTREALLAIGTDHPLVTISVSDNKFGVPRYLWSVTVPLPFEALHKCV